MSKPMVIEQGPRHRLVVLPGGQQIIQHPKEVVFSVRSKTQNPTPRQHERLVAYKLAAFSDVEVIDHYIGEFVEDYKIPGSAQAYVARMGVIYWPPLPKGH